MDDSRYSFSLTTFSPSGKLVQINYALNAVAQGSTSLGIKGKINASNLFDLFMHYYGIIRQ
jgi:hypothetical protein